MSNWNYRVIKFVEDGEETFAIREVFYENGVPDLCTTQSTYPASTDGIVGLQLQIDAYQQAMLLPALDYSIFTSTQPTETFLLVSQQNPQQ